MDRVPVVLTGRLTASAWRLAGARARVVTAETCAAAFDDACASSPLVLVDDVAARFLPRAKLAAARRAGRPLVLVVRTGGPAPEVPDVVDVVRRALGVAT